MIRYLAFVFLLSLNLQGNCQEKDHESDRLLQIAREIIQEAGNATLISHDEKGRARARIMDPFPLEEDFTIWFGTNPLSRKVTQIEADERVTLYYMEKDRLGYVSLYGRAITVDDLALKRKYFKEAWQEFYPSYPEGYILLKFSPEWMEIISIPHGINGDTITWTPPAVEFDRNKQ